MELIFNLETLKEDKSLMELNKIELIVNNNLQEIFHCNNETKNQQHLP